MFDEIMPKVKKGEKIVVGLGDSFTHGIGSWDPEVYKQHNGKIDVLKMDRQLQIDAYKNSWVNVLCDEFLKDYKPINLGVMGTGNRAASSELQLYPEIEMENAKHGIVIFALSGLERFDFINRDFPNHHHFYTMWPNHWDKNATNKKLWEVYAKDLYSEKFAFIETIIAVKNAYTFAKSMNWDFVFANAFDNRFTRERMHREIEAQGHLTESLPWDCYFAPDACDTLIEDLLNLEGRPELKDGGFYPYYTNLAEPSEYITNCAHPSKMGHKRIAYQFYNHLRRRRVV